MLLTTANTENTALYSTLLKLIYHKIQQEIRCARRVRCGSTNNSLNH